LFRNWLENLLGELHENRIVTSLAVESGKLLCGKGSIPKNFGTTYKDFQEQEFQNFVKKITKRKTLKGGMFMPCAIYQDIFKQSGGYPEGNRKEKSGKITSADKIFFYETLKKMNISHFTVYDSIIYHIQEGEKDD